jgi:hypothetical protein
MLGFAALNANLRRNSTELNGTKDFAIALLCTSLCALPSAFPQAKQRVRSHFLLFKLFKFKTFKSAQLRRDCHELHQEA